MIKWLAYACMFFLSALAIEGLLGVNMSMTQSALFHALFAVAAFLCHSIAFGLRGDIAE